MSLPAYRRLVKRQEQGEAHRLSPVRSRRRGFTLIELIVVIAIGSILVGSVTVAIANIRTADLKSATGMMAGAMRYMYNLAVINNRPYRLVIDMDESTFWGEEPPDGRRVCTLFARGRPCRCAVGSRERGRREGEGRRGAWPGGPRPKATRLARERQLPGDQR